MAQELKPFKLGSVELGEYWAYDADEVDAVLAEKDSEIRRLKAQKAQAEDDCAYWKTMAQKNAADNAVMAKQRAEALKRASRQKYNRCLLRSVIAEMNAIHFKDLFYGEDSEALADEYNKQITIHYKWRKRWLELAEKFKEAK